MSYTYTNTLIDSIIPYSIPLDPAIEKSIGKADEKQYAWVKQGEDEIMKIQTGLWQAQAIKDLTALFEEHATCLIRSFPPDNHKNVPGNTNESRT